MCRKYPAFLQWRSAPPPQSQNPEKTAPEMMCELLFLEPYGWFSAARFAVFVAPHHMRQVLWFDSKPFVVAFFHRWEGKEGRDSKGEGV